MRPNKPVGPHELLASMLGHVGAANGIHVKDLAARLRCPARHVRTLVTALREDGVAVCGRPESGYFIAETAEELEETCAFLRERALHSLTLEARLRRVPLPDLLGQLHLHT